MECPNCRVEMDPEESAVKCRNRLVNTTEFLCESCGGQWVRRGEKGRLRPTIRPVLDITQVLALFVPPPPKRLGESCTKCTFRPPTKALEGLFGG